MMALSRPLARLSFIVLIDRSDPLRFHRPWEARDGARPPYPPLRRGVPLPRKCGRV